MIPFFRFKEIAAAHCKTEKDFSSIMSRDTTLSVASFSSLIRLRIETYEADSNIHRDTLNFRGQHCPHDSLGSNGRRAGRKQSRSVYRSASTCHRNDDLYDSKYRCDCTPKRSATVLDPLRFARGRAIST